MARLTIFVILAVCLSAATAAEIALAVEDVQEEYSITSISEPTKIAVKPEGLAVDSSVSEALKATLVEAQTKVDVSFDINEQVDNILNQISHSLLMGSYDPAALSDRTIEFEYKPLLVTYSGTLELSNGQLQELSTVNRNGDATLVYTYPAKVLKVSVPLSYDTLIATYDFTMSVRGDTVSGVLIAWATGITASYNLEASVEETISVTSTDFSLDIGSFDLSIYSVDISTSYKNLVTSLTSDLLKESIVENTDSIINEHFTIVVENSIASLELF